MLKTVFACVTLGALVITPATQAVEISSSRPLIAQIPTTQTNFFKPRKDESAPGESDTAGTRSGVCIQDLANNAQNNLSSQPLLFRAIIPQKPDRLTVKERPTFFIVLPKTSAKEIRFKITADGLEHSQQTISIANRSGLIPIQLSENLEVGKEYRWSMVLVCGENITPNDPAIFSWIRRIEEPSFTSQLNQKPILEQAIEYANQGIGYDALEFLVQAQQEQPNNQQINEFWNEVLQLSVIDPNF